MEATDDHLLTEVEIVLRKKFDKESAGNKRRVQSTASDAAPYERLDQLVLPVNERGKMPHTKDKYLVKENPHLVAWERETRLFLRQLTPNHGHRVSAVMVYEWATGITILDLQQAERDGTIGDRAPWRSDLRKINQILRFYFGKPYMTYICGRKVPRCYRVPPGYYIKRHRPNTLTLWYEYSNGTLNP